MHRIRGRVLVPLTVLALTAACTGGSTTANPPGTGPATALSGSTVGGTPDPAPSATSGSGTTTSGPNTAAASRPPTTSSTPGTAPPVTTTAITATTTSTATSSGTSSATTPLRAPLAGELTGPGVTASVISLGVLADPSSDRGYTQGLDLWADSVNSAGGVCGRTIRLVSAGADGTPVDLQLAYEAIGTSVLGFSTLADDAVADGLSEALTRDGIPALTPSGSSTSLTRRSPTVLGPTDDVIGLSLVNHLVTDGLVPAGSTVGVVSDGSPTSVDTLIGAQWEAARAGVTLDVADAATGTPADWSAYPAVIVLADPEITLRTLTEIGPNPVVITTLAGYDPETVGAIGAGRLRVAQATPTFASDHPGAPTVVAAFTAAGLQDPGVLLFQGWATGSAWQRLLENGCEAATLTRDGMVTAMETVGPAPLDSLLGASDPAGPLTLGRPASLSVAVALADPAAVDGLTPITGLVIADGAEEYLDGG